MTIASPLLITLGALLWGALPQTGMSPARPNIVVILADDLGYSDLGCYGGEIQTPNLDRLAAGGLRFSQFYNTARCWPSRAALLTGYYAQEVRRDTVPGVASGGQGKRPQWAKLLPEMLHPLGYRSYHAGKWHVDGMPLANGFDRSYYVEDVGRYFNPRVRLRRRPEATAGQAGDRLLHARRHCGPRHQISEGARRESSRATVLSLPCLQLASLSVAGSGERHRPVPRPLSCRLGGCPGGPMETRPRAGPGGRSTV